MGFLSPGWLLLTGAVAVPLILHLLQRQPGPRVVFPAVRYLKRAEREHARRIRLRQILLLLLRVAALMLVAFAAARPFIPGAGVGHAPTAAVIVLDNSLSSGFVDGDRRVLDELKDRALEALSRAGPDDRFWLLRAGAPWEPALPGDAQTVAMRVRETQPTVAAADLVGAVRRARDILAQGADGRAREIQVLSDLQTTNVYGATERLTNVGEGDAAVHAVVWSPKREAQPNAAVAAVTVGGGFAPRAGERTTVVADITGSAQDSLSVRVSVDGRITGAAIGVPGSAAVMPLPARNPSLVVGEVQIDADRLRADDRRFFVATITPPPRVTLTRATPFVSEALAVLVDAGRVRRVASGGDVVLAPNAVGAEAAGGTGSVVILPPESPLELPAVNRRLAALGINWRFELQREGGDRKFAGAGTGDELQRALATVRVSKLYRLVPAGPTGAHDRLLRLDDGSAWAIRGTRARGGRFVLLASPLTVDATTLPASAAMIPLLDRLTGAWSAPDAPRSEVLPGERVTMPRNAEEVVRPDGAREKVTAGETYNNATDPGAYRVAAGGKVIGAFVVNPARGESDLQYADGKRVERAFVGLSVKRAEDADAWQKNIYGSRVGREFWRTLLMLLLALLLIEAFAAATGTVKSRAS